MRRKGLIMKTIHNTKIIGIDHGYGNMKTANCCFPTGITAYEHEPLFTADMLVYNGKYYLIGEGHKEFAPDKIKAEIGWYPETMFKEGIRKTIAWYFEHEDWMNNVTSGDYQKYYNEMYEEK